MIIFIKLKGLCNGLLLDLSTKLGHLLSYLRNSHTSDRGATRLFLNNDQSEDSEVLEIEIINLINKYMRASRRRLNYRQPFKVDDGMPKYRRIPAINKSR